MLDIKECVGIQSYKKDGKTIRTIHYIEPFPTDECQGMKVGTIYLGTKDYKLKVGDKFQALYDCGQSYDQQSRKWVNIPVLADIQIVGNK